MKTILFLIPLALFLGLVGLGAFLWSLRNGQFEDLEGAALRIFIDDDEEDKDNSKEQKDAPDSKIEG